MRKWFFMILAILSIVSPAFAQDTFPVFFQKVYEENSEHYQESRKDDYRKLCERYGLAKDSKANQKIFYQVVFFHELFTGKGAVNCVSGGVLEIPYFWHWVTPNPRHAIIYRPDGKRLDQVKPPKAFARYKTYADIDRVPSFYLSDLITDNPKYKHPRCGSFYTFGWCSEREMAFSLLMSLSGFECKVKQEGIHVWSELWTEFAGADGKKVNLLVKVDNTFDTVEWERIPSGLSRAKWLADVGSGAQVRWYNEVVRSEQERTKVSSLTVSPTAAKRIRKKIKNYF